jgi:flagellar motor switch protein FliM
MAENETPSDDDAAAAEWAAMLEQAPAEAEDAAAGATDSGRVLNQNEIDSLLGFDSVQTSVATSDGIHAILDKSRMAYEKLPMMEVVFDRLVRQLSTSLRVFTSDSVDVSIDSMTSLRFDDYLNSIPLPALLVVFRAVEWENFGMVMVDSALIYSMVDILLGGRKTPKTMRVEGRPYTTIEQDLIRRMVDVVLLDMSTAFEPLSPATFQFERLETNPRFATITRPSNTALLIKLRVDIEERGGLIEILLPHTTLEPIRDILLQMFMGEKFGQDTVWEKHLGKELRQTDLPVDAVLNEKQILLGDVMRFKVGSTLMLDCKPDDDIVLKSGGVELTTGRLGRIGDKMAVSLNDPIKRKQSDVSL